MADEFDDLSPDEAEALKEQLAIIRKKKAAAAQELAAKKRDLAAQLKAAQEEAARLEAELGGFEFSEEDQWNKIEEATPEERQKMAREQKKLAEEFAREQAITGAHSGPRSDFLRRAWGQDGEEAKQAQSVSDELRSQGAREGIMPTGHGRTARRASEYGQEHKPGALSSTARRTAEEELGAEYANGVRVIKHRFKTRAWNPRTRVDDETLPELRKKHRMDDD